MLLCYSPNTSEMNNLNLVNITPNISVHYAGGDWELTQHHCYMYCTVLYCTVHVPVPVHVILIQYATLCMLCIVPELHCICTVPVPD